LIVKEIGDKLIEKQILCECRNIKGSVLIHKGARRVQRYVLYGLPSEAIITMKWRITE